MIWSAILFLMQSTAGHIQDSDWKLAFNIHPADGHNFGYGAASWEDTSDVGTDESAFTADYKSNNVTNTVANYIAIVRHHNGFCEAARVWEFRTFGKTLHDYFDHVQTSRLKATRNNYIYSYMSPYISGTAKDPIFAVDGGLVFNWWYGSSNGVRIGNSKTGILGKLPSAADNSHDDYHGIGNEFGANIKDGGKGSVNWWHDVSVLQSACNFNFPRCKVQGSDHGASLSDGTLLGQYAIFTSLSAETFPCKDAVLRITMPTYATYDVMTHFNRIDKDGNRVLDFTEFEFDKDDTNNDGVLSVKEYADATNKDGGITLKEYAAAHHDISGDIPE